MSHKQCIDPGQPRNQDVPHENVLTETDGDLAVTGLLFEAGHCEPRVFLPIYQSNMLLIL